VHGAEQVSKLGQRVDGNQRRANRELKTDWIEHPRRKRTNRLIWQPNVNAIGGAASMATVNADALPKQWVPAVVNRQNLGIVCIM
jgi:hypothetical protein